MPTQTGGWSHGTGRATRRCTGSVLAEPIFGEHYAMSASDPSRLYRLTGFEHRVSMLARDEGDEAIVRAVEAMASALGPRVAVEGVETRGQLARLRDLRCELAQGYHFARPHPAKGVATLLHAAGTDTQRRFGVAG